MSTANSENQKNHFVFDLENRENERRQEFVEKTRIKCEVKIDYKCQSDALKWIHLLRDDGKNWILFSI